MDNLTKTLYTIIRPYTWRLLWILALMMFVVGIEAISPWPFKFLIDNVLGNETFDPGTFPAKVFNLFNSQQYFGYFVVFMFFLISLLSSFLEYFRSIATKNTIREIIFRFSQLAFKNMESFDIGFFRKQEVGDIIYRLSYDVTSLGDFIELGILPFISSALYLILTTIFMLTISIKLTLISLAVVPVLAIGLYNFNKHIDSMTKKSERWNSMVFSYVQEVLNQLKIVQAFSEEKKESEVFDKTMGSSLKTDVRLYRLNFLLSLLVGVIIAISYSIIIAIGISYFFNGELTTGLLIVFIFYLDNLTNPILDIIYASSSLKESWVKINRMSEFFSKKTKMHDLGTLNTFNNFAIEFKNVTLEGTMGKKILDNISLKIKPGKLTVIVGVSGSGKTSLVSLIPRLINTPSHGEIIIGNHNVNEYKLEDLRKEISIVPQETVLFNQTIYDIIAYGKPGCTLEEVKKAAALAGAAEFIHDHPNGYHFKVGEEGNFLSGGQRQRLMLARAFIKNANIYIFDEPLSSLDIKTRSEVWKKILEVCHNKTTIIVSNVLDVITKADDVIFMNKGKIVETGNHLDLLEKSNLYNLMMQA